MTTITITITITIITIQGGPSGPDRLTVHRSGPGPSVSEENLLSSRWGGKCVCVCPTLVCVCVYMYPSVCVCIYTPPPVAGPVQDRLARRSALITVTITTTITTITTILTATTNNSYNNNQYSATTNVISDTMQLHKLQKTTIARKSHQQCH